MAKAKKNPAGTGKSTYRGKGKPARSGTSGTRRTPPAPPPAGSASTRATRPAGYGTSVPPDVDRLTPVTMTVCTRRDFPGALGDDYLSACAALDLPAASKGYALIQTQDVAGACWSVISTDVDGVQTALSIEAMGVSYGYTIDAHTVVTVRPGWILDSTLGLVDRPAPHLPLGPGGPARPEPLRGWAPKGRRELADQIGRELEDPPGFSRAEYFQTMYGDSDPEPDDPRMVDLLRVRTDLTQPVIQEALSGAWSLAAQQAPEGTIRAVTAGATVRMVRASGPGWSLLARPGERGPAVLLLDDLPGAVIDLAGAERLDALLGALVEAAGRS